jgi:hypothetical protein
VKWLFVVAVIWGAWMLLRKPKPKRTGPDTLAMREAVEARDLLGVPAGADADAIRSAHRRLLATIHPDRGGSTELAGRANAARDLLLSLRG